MLKEFFEDFKENNSEELANLWTFNEYETSLGTREELMFDNAVFLQKMPQGELALLILQGVHPQKLYDHTRYLIQELLYWMDGQGRPSMDISLYGSAYQAMVPLMTLTSIKVTEKYARGTVEILDRHGNPREREISKIVGVNLTLVR